MQRYFYLERNGLFKRHEYGTLPRQMKPSILFRTTDELTERTLSTTGDETLDSLLSGVSNFAVNLLTQFPQFLRNRPRGLPQQNRESLI
jgi:hypothetical protein